jgi:hypothetical protein
MNNASTDLRTVPTAERPDLVTERHNHLVSLGFTRESIEQVRQEFRLTLIAAENIDGKIRDLKERGFADPVKMITTLPAILNYTIENIDGKIRDLKERGFADPVKMITTLPAILSLAIETIDGKIRDLKERGFADPVKMITSHPVILSYAIETIDGKIRNLKECGFPDPVKMITSFPPILGLAIENIDGKIGMMQRVSAQFDYEGETAPAIIERELSLLGTKIDKLWTLVRVLCERSHQPSPKDIHTLLFVKLEHVVLAQSKVPAEASFEQVRNMIKTLKKAALTREEMRSQIADLLRQHPDSKVLQRYARGYPLTNIEGMRTYVVSRAGIEPATSGL